MSNISFTAPSHYDVLGIPADTQLSQSLLRKYYHLALLRHHPDKLENDVTLNPARFSIDQIKTAFQELKISMSTGAQKEGLRKRMLAANPTDSFDLDDFEYREDGKLGQRFVKGCRCGADEGYIIPESLLEDTVVEEGPGWKEVEVYCIGCSLKVLVGYQALNEIDEGGV